MKSPCQNCHNRQEDKRKFQACVECNDRIKYSNMVTGPIAVPSMARPLRNHDPESNQVPSDESESNEREVMQACSMCGSILPLKDFRKKKRGTGRIKLCPGCDAISIRSMKKNNGTSIPPGFVRYHHNMERGKKFMSISSKGILVSAAAMRAIGMPKRVDIYYNPETKQIGVYPKSDGASSMSFKNGTATASCSMLIKEHRIKTRKRVPVEIKDGFVMTKEGA